MSDPRARVYEIVLREGGPEDVLTYLDGVLLIDLWDELVLPRDIRTAWAPVVQNVVPVAAYEQRGHAAAGQIVATAAALAASRANPGTAVSTMASLVLAGDQHIDLRERVIIDLEAT